MRLLLVEDEKAIREAVAAWKAGTFEKATPKNSSAPHYPAE